MRINHNIAALNTHRQLSQANNANQQSMEKLSSGLRINRAGDDAAGLAISEKMRGQIRGLEQAQTNAQDGISMIQTAEGAMNESHSILQRMRELSVQSSNDTNTSSDRAELQKEVDQLSQELSRIGDNTEFNTQNLLDGSFEGTFQIGANEGQNLDVSIDDMRGASLGVVGNANGKMDVQEVVGDANGQFTNGSSIDDGTYTVKGNDEDGYTLEVDVTDGGDTPGSQTVTLTSQDGKTFTGTTAEFDSDGSGTMLSDDLEIDFGDVAVTSGDVTLEEDPNNASGQVATSTGSIELDNSDLQAGEYTLSADGSEILDTNNEVVATHDGANGYEADGEVVLETADTLVGGSSLEIGGIDISSQEAAGSATTKINEAIEKVSAERSMLGATQNRLEHTINNLGTTSENLTAAESRIRDVDYASAA